MSLEQLPDLVQQFLFGFGTLFAIINPYGLSFIFLDRTLGLSDAERKVVAKRVAISAFCVLAVSLVAGTTILGFFGITLSALRIGGGLVVAVSGWVMLHEPIRQSDPSARSGQTLATLKSMTLFPLTIPLTTGPGSIATAIALAANRPPEVRGFVRSIIISLIVALAISLTILNAYRHAGSMARLFGPEATHAVTRLSAFLLLCVGVQITLTGVLDAVRPLLESR
jgi:multiple antibiotic resistance protein